MTVCLNGKWEAERIAGILESYQFPDETMISWRDDVVNRIRKQVDATRQYWKERSSRSKLAAYRTCKNDCTQCDAYDVCIYGAGKLTPTSAIRLVNKEKGAA